MTSEAISDFRSLFLNETPLMDVRAPVEFAQGAFPQAHNRPLMVDQEREAVGTRYKEEGQDAAIQLGHELVQGDIKAERVAAWRAFFEQYPEGVFYCFRGGLRSRVTQQWLQEAGIDRPFVAGGYKAMRRFLLDQLHDRVSEGQVQILAGPTGSGKTDVIHAWPRSLDLEGLANHRGSAFGHHDEAQPAQIDFENAWSIAWLKQVEQGPGPVLVEDESRLIGRISVLPEFLALAKQADSIVLQASVEARVERIRRDYFEQRYQRYQKTDPSLAAEQLRDFVAHALTRIRKRLGGERYQTLMQTLEEGIAALTSRNHWGHFDTLIERLLVDYYDPMYQYQFEQKQNRVLFTGTETEILEWLASR
ncbi:tRNA 2-selenouridine(34) synthase MnmH [Reinekea blandensis]|uniref:tRNA 2-selenouridine synthase n=1 Tax=Reinekea blandensis MED297 TaxID=314283 RepID=A4BDG7_9GAMM|nr:tRNA 2-selenouridine(34) synthase MnmH [Reinekea blandensis]EAR09911.1 hypothetical ATPase [Reinekea sp. MED297] [Reinekea blandensis MED297]